MSGIDTASAPTTSGYGTAYGCGTAYGYGTAAGSGAPAGGWFAVPMAGFPAPRVATGLPVGVRFRRPDVPVTGLPTGAEPQPNSTTPGDLPPRDPLS